MKICVLGFDGGAPQVVFRDERLVNLRRLMDAGVYGLLENVVSPERISAWTSFSTSQPAIAKSDEALTIWDYLKERGKNIRLLVDSESASPSNKDEIFRISAAQWERLQHLLADQEWDCCQFIDLGLDRLQHTFGDENVISDYYQRLDEQVGSVFELIDDETIVLVLSPYGTLKLDDDNRTERGFFILAAPNCPLRGEYEGARLLDMAPTLLDLAGYDIPQSMQGKSLVTGMEKKSANPDPDDGDAQKLIQDRLAGLGYI
jgi:predicted AlkP superfamily phosphohydrolase/phosphomutase